MSNVQSSIDLIYVDSELLPCLEYNSGNEELRPGHSPKPLCQHQATPLAGAENRQEKCRPGRKTPCSLLHTAGGHICTGGGRSIGSRLVETAFRHIHLGRQILDGSWDQTWGVMAITGWDPTDDWSVDITHRQSNNRASLVRTPKHHVR